MMLQLVKGGKYAFGWSQVGDQGRIVIPPEALGEYGLMESQKLILIPGSRTSGGFGLASQESLRKSPLGSVAEIYPNMEVPQGEVVEYKGKPYCWVELLDGGITLPAGTLEKYGVRIGDRLLVIRGSSLAVGFAVRGPIVAEAKGHRELEVFEPKVGGLVPRIKTVKLLEEIKYDLNFIKSHSLQPKWYKLLKILILLGFLAGYGCLFGSLKTVVFFVVFVFLSFLLHLLYRAKTDKFKRSWLDFIVVEEENELKAKSIGKFYYSAVVLNAIIASAVSQVIP